MIDRFGTRRRSATNKGQHITRACGNFNGDMSDFKSRLVNIFAQLVAELGVSAVIKFTEEASSIGVIEDLGFLNRRSDCRHERNEHCSGNAHERKYSFFCERILNHSRQPLNLF